MTTDSFRATAQYNDFEGTFAGDAADHQDLTSILDANNLRDAPNEFVVGARLYIAENHHGKVREPWVQILLVQMKDATFDKIRAWLSEQHDPLPVRSVEVELTLEQFVGLFKRFSVVMTRKGLGLTDREYRHDD